MKKELQEINLKKINVLSFFRNHLYFLLTAFLSIVGLALFATIMEDVVAREPIVNFDSSVIHYIQFHRIEFLNDYFINITKLGNIPIVITIFVIILIVLFYYKRHTFILALVLALGGDGLFVFIIKDLVKRARPDRMNTLINESGFSFPSGHTFIAICFYGLITYFLVTSSTKIFYKVLILIVAIFLILSICVSRVYLGVHYPSDVISSFLFSSVYLSIIIFFVEKNIFKKIYFHNFKSIVT